MKSLLTASLLYVSSANAAHLECTMNSSRDSFLLEEKELSSCPFLEESFVCLLREGNDQFSAYAFDANELSNAHFGQSVSGLYVEGYIYKTWEVTSKEELTCVLL